METDKTDMRTCKVVLSAAFCNKKTDLRLLGFRSSYLNQVLVCIDPNLKCEFRNFFFSEAAKTISLSTSGPTTKAFLSRF